jgi:PPK2 family polyphosphate:nucleotide phosphotransferase
LLVNSPQNLPTSRRSFSGLVGWENFPAEPSGVAVKTIAELIAPFRVTKGKKFRLADYDPADTAGLKPKAKDAVHDLMARGLARLTDLQDRLYADDRWGVLLIFQAMDAAGKDGAIKHVMSGVNPQGCQVYSFKSPSAEDLDHDFLWRTSRCLPERGRIGIFNRSYYEEVLVVRVHPEYLAKQRLPPALVTDQIWKQRYEDISAFERYASRNGICIRKFYLNVSRKEQRRRFLARLDEPEKNWKFSAADISERAHWDAYMDAYEDAIRHTASPEAPWFVVPADHKWVTRLVVMGAVIDALEGLDLSYPKVSAAEKRALKAARSQLKR